MYKKNDTATNPQLKMKAVTLKLVPNKSPIGPGVVQGTRV